MDISADDGELLRLRDKSTAALAALVAANAPTPSLFIRSGLPVRVGLDEHRRPGIKTLTPAALRGHLERVANFVNTSDDRGCVPIAPPKDVVEDLLEIPTLPAAFPPLEGIVTGPVVAADGTLVTTPGYLPSARLFYHERSRLDLGDTRPTSCNVDAARGLFLDEMLGDFPFVDEASRAHALALLFLPFVRPRIAGPAPFHLVDAPTPGSGKSLLVEVASAVFVPDSAAASATPGSKDEDWTKRLTSALMSGNSHIWFDNISHKIDNGQFALALTAGSWRDRVMGGNTEATLPIRCVWVGTANNAQLSDEITRRTVWIRLDAQQEKPWERGGFAIGDLPAWTRRMRPRLLGAAVTLLRAWLEAGSPPWLGQPMGSYETWSRVMGGILEVAGVPGFLENRAELYDRLDPEREKWCQFLRAWHEAHAEKPVGVADVIDLAVQAGIVMDAERGARNALGKQLKLKQDRIFAGYRLTRAATRDRLARYQVLNVSPASSPDVSNVSAVSEPNAHVLVSPPANGTETHIRRDGSDTADTFDTSGDQRTEEEREEANELLDSADSVQAAGDGPDDDWIDEVI